MRYAILPDDSKQCTFPNASSGAPAVDCGLKPERHGHRAHVTRFAHQVENRPMSVPTLNPFDLQAGHLRSSKAATEQETQHGSVSFSAKRVGTHRAHELLTLPDREPVADRLSEPFYALDPADTRHQLGAEQATV